MRKNVVVIIPFYHSELTELEKISLHNCLTVLKKYTIILLIPEKMLKKKNSLPYSLPYDVVPDAWLDSIASYNRMMLTKDFYMRFIQYEYMLIFQLDAFVFSDSLEWFCNLGYDYIGAPWLKGWKYLRDIDKGVWHVGNGGFSLRRISAFIDIFNSQLIQNVREQEDLFWASCDSEIFHVAPLEVALKFSFEQDVRQCYLQNGKSLPFGCHAWEKYDFDFWRPIFERQGYYLSTQILDSIDKHNNYLRPKPIYLEANAAVVKLCLSELSMTKKCSIHVFGANETGRECVWLLRHSNLHNVSCVDNNSNLWGNMLWDIEIRSPHILKDAEKRNKFIVIAVRTIKAQNEILYQLEKWGYKYGRNVIFYSNLIMSIEDKL